MANRIVNLDDTPQNADWIKSGWDLPPYRSDEFYRQVRDVEEFKRSPIYAAACQNGLICDDEWVGNYCYTLPSRTDKDLDQ
jgi:hypothetical protein